MAGLMWPLALDVHRRYRRHCWLQLEAQALAVVTVSSQTAIDVTWWLSWQLSSTRWRKTSLDHLQGSLLMKRNNTSPARARPRADSAAKLSTVAL